MKIYLNDLNYKYEIFELIRTLIGQGNFEFVDDVNYLDNILIIIINGDLEIKYYLNNEIEYNKKIKNIKQTTDEYFKEKMLIKGEMLRFFEEKLNISSDWGVLTGIRPVKVARSLINKYGREYSEKILKDKMLLKENKIDLITSISTIQETYISRLKKNSYSLYINIPFCPTRCDYCSFSTLKIEKHKDLVPRYLKTIVDEMNSLKKYLRDFNLSTIYIGGGTPTTLNEDNLKYLLSYINENFKNPIEFTVEAGREDTLSSEKLKLLKEENTTRISLNPQTFKSDTLKLIGRKQNNNELIKRYYEARELNFDSINMDLIIGLPRENLTDFKNTLEIIKDLSPENLTIHTLAVKKGSKISEKSLNLEDEKNNVLNMMNMAVDFANKNDFIPYYLYRQKQILGNMENIGFSKKGKECIYNITMMEEVENIIGIGMGASSKIIKENNMILNHRNYMNMRDYLENIDKLILKKIELIGEAYD
ncbi:coproporphyrinogen dehydrogenase HemZ [Miniphocaeibacter halophilus]|uniref:Coproporphyrinogen dehydrogenase HemZ n=1 Tax=Miniphocaeibacter halophilus TaxID=2931922 RepID=A0AC61MS11_9FIRM|nr:coproporphyrinogen dehydrogenase HemZ [Miniphocaeibacter halophilus]QQK08465.1 coproporphyrinogen dehydrogenase HemZ [Miniphocaeibacter halophilus]